ncbi:hypothetical protein HU200_005150 [Digitaria exilis]|uniref:Ribosome biogenesis protein NSA2 homolog n=1 Tax=Digitaria exilis TaxID=1010633 RepID=A0A835FUW1_9POAL|nr:hypothetical protein HU200_005150 [Digitaria exilis]
MGDHIELHQKRHGKRLDYEERKRKRQARELLGAKGKRFAKKRYAEKAQMKKTFLATQSSQKRKEKAGKWDVPLPKVRPVAEEEMFKVLRTGKRKTKQWKRMVTKATFVGAGFTRKPPKYERFIRPTGLRFTKAHVNVSELGLVTPAGKVVWGKYAQVTNNPENDGCINAVLLV